MTHTDESPLTTHLLLEGTWVNQLGSEVTFTPDPEGGLHGEYCGGAGALAGRRYPVTGSYQPRPLGPAVPVAFLVSWAEAHCVTTWCGHLLTDRDEIEATWLMATEAESARDQWRSTVIGHDVFRRVPDTGA